MKRLLTSLGILFVASVFLAGNASDAYAQNVPPIPHPKIRVNGASAKDSLILTYGARYTITLDNSASTDPNGWNTAGTGVASGGYCAWNASMSQYEVAFNTLKNNPATPQACNITLNNFVFPTHAGVYYDTYDVLRIRDAGGLTSLVGKVTIKLAEYPKAKVSINNGPFQGTPVVSQGVPTRVAIKTDFGKFTNNSTPPASEYKVVKCEINTDYSLSPTFERTIDNPGSTSDCDMDLGNITFTDRVQTHYFPIYRITDSHGGTAIGYEFTRIEAGSVPPVAIAKLSANGGTSNSTITVTRGVPTKITLDASASTDPDGWTNTTKGVSSGGKCQINTDLNQGTPTYEKTVSNPANPAACNFDFGTRTFNDVPGTYTYNLLSITDASGIVSNVGVVTIKVVAPANKPPVAIAELGGTITQTGSADLGTVQGHNTSHLYIPRGVPIKITRLGNKSSDPEGWGDIKNGGKCEWNTDFNQGTPTYELAISNPAISTNCNGGSGDYTFNDPLGTYTYSLLRVTDRNGNQSVGTVQITIVPPNQRPIGVARVSVNGGPLTNTITVAKGQTVSMTINTSGSSDPDGWTTARTGVSSGGRCQTVGAWGNTLDIGGSAPVVQNPPNPSACGFGPFQITFNQNPGTYEFALLRIFDAIGASSNPSLPQMLSVTVTGSTTTKNPVAVAKLRVNGGSALQHITVARGVPVTLGFDAAGSSDPDGWTTVGGGVSPTGKCEINTDMNQGIPTYEKTVSKPASAAACNTNLGTRIFNDAPGTYTYGMLLITDSSGLKSNIGTVRVTILGNGTPTPSPTPVKPTPTGDPKPSPTSCTPVGYNFSCPSPTPTGDPTPTPTGDPTPTPTGEPTPDPSETPVFPTPPVDPTVSPNPCIPGVGVDCNDILPIVAGIINKIGEGIEGLFETSLNAITELAKSLAAFLGLTPEFINKIGEGIEGLFGTSLNTITERVKNLAAFLGLTPELMQEKGNLIASFLTAAALALSAPLLATSVLPQALEWSRFLGSFFVSQKKKDRWGIIVDSDIGQPIANAVVQVFDAVFNQLKETQLTGPDGQFGFLLLPGQYYIVASEPGFVFPAKKRRLLTLHGNERIYLGESFTITDQNPENIPHLVVPMDREVKISATRALFARSLERIIRFADRIGFLFLFVGAGINTYLLFVFPGKLNMFFEVVYLLLFILKLYLSLSHTHGIGSVTDKATKKRLDLAIVRLYDNVSNRMVQTRVSNKNGQFFLLVPKGVYTISVSKQGYQTYTINHVVIKKNASTLSLDIALEVAV